MRKFTFVLTTVVLAFVVANTASAQGLPIPEAKPPQGSTADAPVNRKGDKGWLGVGLATTMVDGKERVAVDSVFKGSPADSSGFLAGDVILGFQGKDVKDIPALIAAVGGTPPGSKVTFKVRRGTEEFDVPLLLAVRPDRLGLLRNEFLNKKAPEFSVAIRGKKKRKESRESLEGKVVVIDFWATWCGPCRATIPALNDLHRKYKAKGVVVLGVTDEERRTVDGFLKDTKIEYPIGMDGKGRGMNKAFYVQAYPTLMLMDKKGVIREVFIGASSDKMQKLEARIDELLKQ